MTDPLLGNLFGKKGPEVEATLDALVNLTTPVGAGAFSFKSFQVSGGQGLTLLDQPVQITDAASLTAAIGAPGAGISSLFQDGDSWTIPADQSLASLTLDGSFGVAGKGTLPHFQPVALTFSLNASSALTYRHLLATPAATLRLEALKDLVVRANLPQLVALDALRDGEAHQWTALFSLDLGAEATVGKEFAVKLDLFKGLAPEVSIDFQYAAKASLNASLYERLRWTVGKGGSATVNPGWVRVRAEREKERQLTLGAQFTLDIQYDLGNSLEALLNRVLALNPIARAMTALQDIQSVNDLIKDGNFAAIEQKLGQVAASRISEFLDPILADSQAVQKLVAASQEAVDAYAKLGDTLQSFWDGLLNRGDLAAQRQKLRAVLERIAALPDDPKQLLSPAAQDLIPLLETLSGVSLEEILLASPVTPLLPKAKAEATRALSFLDAVEKFPDTVLARIEDFAKRTGIAGTLDWLEANTTSVAKLQAAVNARIEKLIEKLLGKAVAQIDPADLAKLQGWAQSLAPILAAPAELEQELRAKFQQLNGSLGFKLAFEVDRVSRSTALLDLEIDPTDAATVQAVSGLSSGSLAAVLKALPTSGDPQTDAAPLPYLLRECTFTSSHERTSTRSLFFSLLGLETSVRRRMTESAITVQQDGAAITRQGTYTGDFYASESIEVEKSGGKSKCVLGASAGWVARTAGPGTDLAAPYQDLDSGLSLTFTRDDDSTQPGELPAIAGLLADLGFDVSSGIALPAAGLATSLAVNLTFGASAVADLLTALDAAWNLDYLNAARRWLDEPLVPTTEINRPDVRRGAAVAAILSQSEEFRAQWDQDILGFENAELGRVFQVTLPGLAPIAITLLPKVDGKPRWIPYGMVREIVIRHRSAIDSWNRAGAALPGQGTATHRTLGRFGERFARAMNAAAPDFWPNPAFAVWLVLSRLARVSPAGLAAAAGVASFRSKDAASGEWSAPQSFLLDPARLPRRTPGAGVFPIG